MSQLDHQAVGASLLELHAPTEGTQRSGPSCVYIAGSGRNGSTLLGMLLGRRPGTLFAGELTHMWRRGYLNDELCGCGEPFSKCAFWQEVTRAAFGAPTRNDMIYIESLRNEISAFRRIPWLLVGRRNRSPRIAEYQAIYVQLLNAIAAVSGSRYVVDSSKYPTDLDVISRTGTLPLYVLHLVRDCNAVVFSWKKKKLRPEIHWTQQLMPRYRTPTVALGWRFFNSAISRTGAELSGRYRCVRYEDLVLGFPGSVADVASWVGIDGDPDPHSTPAGNHTVSGNPCRFADPTNITLDEEWRGGLSGANRILVRLLCGRTQRSLGYR